MANPFEPEETDIDRQTNVIFRQQRLTIENLEEQVAALKQSAGIWEFFAGLTQGERLDLVTRFDNGFDLSDGLARRMTRPPEIHRYPGNDERVNEQAGHYADTYRGGGWMAVRSLLVSFHKHCVKLGI